MHEVCSHSHHGVVNLSCALAAYMSSSYQFMCLEVFQLRKTLGLSYRHAKFLPVGPFNQVPFLSGCPGRIDGSTHLRFHATSLRASLFLVGTAGSQQPPSLRGERAAPTQDLPVPGMPSTGGFVQAQKRKRTVAERGRGGVQIRRVSSPAALDCCRIRQQPCLHAWYS